MFPHSETVFAVHDLRLQDGLRNAARQRLAATAVVETETRPMHLALSSRLARILGTVRTSLQVAAVERSAAHPGGDSERPNMVHAGLA